MMSFLRKYAALSDMPVSNLMKLFIFHPLRIGKSEFIHGGKFQMFYSLHSIPTFGFKMDFQDQTFVYSSDHNNDPAVHKKLLDERVITPERYKEFRDFPWDSKVIYHESGVPPLHTPIAYLNSLPKEIQKKTVVYHIAAKDFPKETSLTLATFGIEKTLVFPTTTPYYDKAYQVLNVLNHLDFFRDMEITKAQSFLTIVQEEHFKKGECIIRKGTAGDKFYVILSGNVSVAGEGLETRKIYGTYEYFGEVAIITGKPMLWPKPTLLPIRWVATLSTLSRELVQQTLVRSRRFAAVIPEFAFREFPVSLLFVVPENLANPFLSRFKTGKGVLVREGERLECITLSARVLYIAAGAVSTGTLRRGDYVGNLTRMYRRAEALCTIPTTDRCPCTRLTGAIF